MQWLNKIVDEVIKRHPDGDIVVSSGVSPSGAYHVGTLREVLTAEIVARELRRRGRVCKHIHVSDDLDVFRKVPVGIPEDYSQYLGRPLCDIPAPDSSQQSYADYYVKDLPVIAEKLNLDMETMRAHKKYRAGFFVKMIELTLENLEDVKKTLVEVSGRKLPDNWSPVQVVEDGYLKSRGFISIDKEKQEITVEGKEGEPQTISYANGDVKLNWRIDWPARWALLGVNIEPFGRDHATKGGSYDTGAVLVVDVFNGEAPYPIPYHFINRTGETKKMSKSGGDTITALQLIEALPSEIVWYFMFKFAPEKQLFFDAGPTLIRLVDEFSELIAKPDKTESEQQLLDLCMHGVAERTVSNIPFSHLVASYQASLRNVDATIDVIKRTEHAETAAKDAQIIRKELKFIDHWLDTYAPEDVKFSIERDIYGEQNIAEQLSEPQEKFLKELAEKIEAAPSDADGEWFHKAIYDFKDNSELAPKELFSTIYRVLINKDSGPRAGYFLSILPRDKLIQRLKLERVRWED